MLPPQDIHKPQGATFVVAASNSLHKERADYVCDGVDDQVEIQAAIDALPAGGGKVVLLEGIYDITQNLIVVETSNVSISGMGKSTLLKGRGTVGGSYKWAPMIRVSSSNVVISNLRCHGGMGVFGYGIDFENSENGLVSGCYVEYTYDDGIVFHNSERCIAENNICVGYNSPHPAHVGIEVEDGSKNILLIDNIITGWHSAWSLKSHEGYVGCDRLSVVNNLCYGNERLIEGGSADPGVYGSNIMILGNRFIGGYWEGSPTQGLNLGDDIQGGIVANNHFKNFTETGIMGYGIRLSGPSLIVQNNVIEDAVYGVYVSSNSIDYMISGNILKNCTIGARFLSNSEYGNFMNNICHSCDEGIMIDDTIDNIIITGNDLRRNTIAINYAGDGTGNTNGIVKNNAGYITKNSGSSTGTGAQQTIAHGLATTPTKVILWNIEDGASPYQSAVADGTNIKITAVINQDWGWEAEVV